MNNTSVVQEWLAKECTWKMQTVLLTSFRGCDGAHKHDYGKTFTRIMRATVLQNADPNGTFFPDSIKTTRDMHDTFFSDMDHYPVHWFMHLLHAAEIAGYKCPNDELRQFWMNFYLRGIKELHVNPESEDHLDIRLRDADIR